VFAALQADRDAELESDRRADAKIGKRSFDGRDIASHLVDGPSKEITVENKD
jgi:hypothetical protein